MIITPHQGEWLHVLSTSLDYETGFGSDAGYMSGLPMCVLDVEIALEQRDAQRRLDLSKGNFANIHTHTEFSALDGLTTIKELIAAAVADNQPGVAVTDHGVCAAHPELFKEASAAGIIPAAGLEAYFVPDRFDKTGGQNYNHLLLIAEDQVGLKNLWAASTEANRTGFYYKPRFDYDLLERYGEGLIASTACLRGVLSDAILNGRYQEADAILARFMALFPDRLYLEIHANQLPDQMRLNEYLVTTADKYGLPLLAAVDSHYPCADDYTLHQRWLRAQTHSNKDKESDDSGLFTGKQDYHLMGREEVRKALSYLPARAVEEALDSTVDLIHQIKHYDIVKSEPPIFSIAHGRSYAIQRLVDLCLANWERKIVNRPHTQPLSVYLERFEYEMGILKQKDFCDYYCIVADYVRAAKEAGILVGPGRGSGTASLVAYLSDITEVDPVEYDLPFARFITVDRVDPPDFDIDFPASKRGWIQHYVAQRWGFDHVARVGTHIRLQNKGAFRDMARLLKEEMPIDNADIDAICKIIEEEERDSAGLGKPWEAVYAANEDLLEPYLKKYPELFANAERILGRLKSYGKHAAGLVISTGEPLTGRLPMRQGDEDQMVVELDFPALEAMGLLKFDFLTLRNLDTLQVCIDLIKERRGVTINFYNWIEEFNDPTVWENISDGHTLGMFQFETKSMTRLVKRMVPTNIRNLADINALVRPGPQRSGMTELYFRRREGRETVQFPHPSLEPLLVHTQGVVIYQEQVMNICKVLAGFDDVNADKVRKILGKKKPEETEAKGREFLAGALALGIDGGIAQALWDQMAEFAKYGFSVCHSVPYSIVGYWCAWLRVNYPEEFMTAVLSTVDKDRVPEFVDECQRMGYRVLPPDINKSAKDFTTDGTSIRYGFLGVKNIGEAAVESILSLRPFTSYEDFRERTKGSKCNLGTIKTLAAVGALDSLYPNRKQLEINLASESSGDNVVCVNKDETVIDAPNGLPCRFDWSSEPILLTAKGKPIKRKDPPKRCTKACRHYSPAGFPVTNGEGYTPEEIQEREMELLGVWLSSTPFDKLPAEIWGNELQAGEAIESAPNGRYRTAAILKSIRVTKDSTGRTMAFADLLAKDATLSTVIFNDHWERYQNLLRESQMGLYELMKTDRGYQLKYFMPL